MFVTYWTSGGSTVSGMTNDSFTLSPGEVSAPVFALEVLTLAHAISDTYTHTLKLCTECAEMTRVQNDGLCCCGAPYAAHAITDSITVPLEEADL